jgi:formamidopyrimidine-DNA glycosylase
MAFCDARRLGRIRLCDSPLKEPPISELGFDPMLCMPPYEEFKALVVKRSCPIKALLLDQSFSAGVGNWVAGANISIILYGCGHPDFGITSDEILYLARVHPEQRCNTLTETQLIDLHNQTQEVCRIAVEANADDSKFPENWLFKHRWVCNAYIQNSIIPTPWIGQR